MWGDFTCLEARGQVPKHSILWVIDVEAPEFQEVWAHVQAGRPDAVSQQQVQALWAAGARCFCSSTSPDFRCLKLHCNDVVYQQGQWQVPSPLRWGKQVYGAAILVTSSFGSLQPPAAPKHP